MKNINLKIRKSINAGAIIKVKDNYGVKTVRVLSFFKYGGVKNRIAKGGIGDFCRVAAQKGLAEYKGKLFYAIITQQKVRITRPDGTKICFEDNGCFLVSQDKKPLGKKALGVFRAEIIQKYQDLSKLKLII